MFTVAVGLILVSSRTPEPAYEGRALSSWLDDVQSWDSDGSAPVTGAFRAMGTNALPSLVGHVVAPRSYSRTRLDYWLRVLGWKKLGNLAGKQEQRREAAFRVLTYMGSDATNALPLVFASMRDDQGGKVYWADALMAVIISDPTVVPVVLEKVREPRHRSSLCFVLGMARVNPEVSISYLTTQLDDEDPSVQRKAHKALVRFTGHDQMASAADTQAGMYPNGRLGSEDAIGSSEPDSGGNR